MNAQGTVIPCTFYREGLKLYGELHMPDGAGPFPAVILSHGFAGNLIRQTPYARLMAANGIAALAFDYAGTCRGRRSDEDPDGSSILTEVKDLNVVLDALRGMDKIDRDRIFLMGSSQGGLVSTYVAATRPEDIRGLVVLYPAYVISDDARKRFPDPDDVPEEMTVMGRRLGRRYHEDAISFDIYEMMPAYGKDVLIMHGRQDPVVPVAYSERAVRTFPSAKLVIEDDAGHGFRGEHARRAGERALKYIREHL